MFQIFDGIFQHNLVVQTILEGVGVVLLGKVRRIEEIVITPLLVSCITVPEASSVSVENSGSVAAVFGKNKRCSLLGISTTVVNHKGSLVETEESSFNHGFSIRSLTSLDLVEDIRESQSRIGVVEGVEERCHLVLFPICLQLIVNQELLEAFQMDIDNIAAFGNPVIFWIRLRIVGLNVFCYWFQVFFRSFGALTIGGICLVSTVT